MPMTQISSAAIEPDRQVGRHGAGPRPPARAHRPDRQAILQKEDIGGTEAEHHQRMAVQAIAQPSPERARAVFLDGERVDVTQPAAVEIAGAGMMGGMGVAPHGVGREGEHAGDPAEPVVCLAVAKEGAMTAIVLDGEKPHEKSGGGDGQRQGQPVADVERRPGQHPKGGQRHDGDGDLDNAPAGAWLPVARKNLCPGASVRHCHGGRRGVLAVFQSRGSFPVQRQRLGRAESSGFSGGQRQKQRR